MSIANKASKTPCLPLCCRRPGKRPVNVRLIRELLRQVPYLIPRYFT